MDEANKRVSNGHKTKTYSKLKKNNNNVIFTSPGSLLGHNRSTVT